MEYKEARQEALQFSIGMFFMQFAELIKEVKCVSFQELRQDSDRFFEAVVIKQELSKLTERLEKFFGIPAWPSNNKISSQVQNVIKDFGGIMPNQTLYFRSDGNDTIFAMLWPWQDKEHITLKIVKK